MKTTTTKTGVKNLPAKLAAAIRAGGCTRRNCRVVVVNDDSFSLKAYNTRWDGGSYCGYFGFDIGGDHWTTRQPGESEQVEIRAGEVVAVVSYFCGQECDPVVYVRNTDLAAFYGVELPAEFQGMPAEVAADWVNERAGVKVAGRRATAEEKAYRLAAEMLRTLTAVPAAV
jgi:hypothetical protein